MQHRSTERRTRADYIAGALAVNIGFISIYIFLKIYSIYRLAGLQYTKDGTQKEEEEAVAVNEKPPEKDECLVVAGPACGIDSRTRRVALRERPALLIDERRDRSSRSQERKKEKI